MKQLQLYNSLAKRKETFIPIDPNNIRMYVCGPTVYDYPHLGNALAVVIYDVLYRLLKFVYGGEKVTYARNITDVDDKIIHAAKEQNITIDELTKKITEIFHDNMFKLNCLNPNFEPKATEHIEEMLIIIQKLIANDFAYEKNNHIYFRVRKFAEYSNLSGRHLDELVAGARVEVAEEKENPEDFVLWKPAPGEVGSFPSPYGEGRPGWHIECSAMSSKYLGDDFDIHGG
ncbi:MAG: class I tRNA ligase family protein, partial [Pseudomonadota bacterium]